MQNKGKNILHVRFKISQPLLHSAAFADNVNFITEIFLAALLKKAEKSVKKHP